jgi:hypothetical protein
MGSISEKELLNSCQTNKPIKKSYDKEKFIHGFDFVNYALSIHYGSVKHNKDPSHGCF